MIEKLVELMAKADEHRDEICVGHGCERCPYEQYGECGIQIQAEYLIANGVRLEENQATSDESKRWIPVTERLPENEQLALCIMVDGQFRVFEWNYIDWMWHDQFEYYREDDVTHWMPLPEPPKGE